MQEAKRKPGRPKGAKNKPVLNNWFRVYILDRNFRKVKTFKHSKIDDVKFFVEKKRLEFPDATIQIIELSCEGKELENGAKLCYNSLNSEKLSSQFAQQETDAIERSKNKSDAEEQNMIKIDEAAIHKDDNFVSRNGRTNEYDHRGKCKANENNYLQDENFLDDSDDESLEAIMKIVDEDEEIKYLLNKK